MKIFLAYSVGYSIATLLLCFCTWLISTGTGGIPFSEYTLIGWVAYIAFAILLFSLITMLVRDCLKDKL